MQRARPFRRVNRPAPFQHHLHAKLEPIRRVLEQGIILDSPDIGARRLPNGQTQLYLKTPISAGTTASATPPTPPAPGPGSNGAFTNFYTDSGGANTNSGSSEGSPIYTSTNGAWVQATRTFTPTDGSNPVSAGVAVGMFLSAYLDGETTLRIVGRITSVTNAVNGAIQIDATAVAGVGPGDGATGRTVKVGGAWRGPNGASGFPFTLSAIGKLKNTTGNEMRVNMKNTASYSITSAIVQADPTNSITVQGYATTAGDGGKATFITASAITVFFTQLACTFIDLVFSNTATTGTSPLVQYSAGTHSFFRCIFSGARGAGLISAGGSVIHECEAYDCNKSNTATYGGFRADTVGVAYIRCYSHDHTAGTSSPGWYFGAGAMLDGCIAESCHGSGVECGSFNAIVMAKNCDFYNNSVDGIKMGSGAYLVAIESCNFLKNAGRGINTGSLNSAGYAFNCGYGSGTMANGSANVMGAITEVDPFTYNSGLDPWVDQTTGNFSIDTGGPGYQTGRGGFTETGNSKSGTTGIPNIGAA